MTAHHPDEEEWDGNERRTQVCVFHKDTKAGNACRFDKLEAAVAKMLEKEEEIQIAIAKIKMWSLIKTGVFGAGMLLIGGIGGELNTRIKDMNIKMERGMELRIQLESKVNAIIDDVAELKRFKEQHGRFRMQE